MYLAQPETEGLWPNVTEAEKIVTAVRADGGLTLIIPKEDLAKLNLANETGFDVSVGVITAHPCRREELAVTFSAPDHEQILPINAYTK